ncbi:hypothetical protein HN747_01895 [archaeon]|nr:hypothetical protein [archaeon]
MCSSEITESEEYVGSWQCKLEPVICPPHGRQTEVCTRYNGDLDEYESREAEISCSPGICSGCYVPRWFDNPGDNRCIPYGMRFEQQTGWTVEEVFREYNDDERLSVSEANQENGVYLRVYENNEALLILNAEDGSSINVSLIEGQAYDWDEITGEGSDNWEYELYVDEIYYDSENYDDSYIEITFSASGIYEQRTADVFDAYCDITGEIKQQKDNSIGSDWATCQNNYECASNICSYGECVDLRGLVNEAKGIKAFFVKIGCRLGNLFNNENYNQCLFDNLGEGDDNPVSNTIITVEVVEDSETVALEKASNKLNIGERLGDVWSGNIDRTELPRVLMDGYFTDNNYDEFDYEQRVYIGNGLELTRFQDNDYGPNEEVGFHIQDGENILNYTINFIDRPLLENMIGEMIEIMGRKMYVSEASSGRIVLIDLPFSFLISENENTGLVVKNPLNIEQEYIIKTTYISSTEVKLEIDGEMTPTLNEGGSFRLNDGNFIIVKEILYSSKDTGISKVELVYGFDKLELINGREAVLNGNSVGEVDVSINDYADGSLGNIWIFWNADDEEFLTSTYSIISPVPNGGFEFSMSDANQFEDETYYTVYLTGYDYNFIYSSSGGGSGGGSSSN